MILRFDNEEIIVKDRLFMFNLEVWANATDASFSHEFGLEVVAEVEFSFHAVTLLSEDWVPGTIDFLRPAVEAWMEKNMDKMHAAFDNARQS
jgi:hypothetical protein